MRISKFVETYKDEIPYYLWLAFTIFMLWFISLMSNVEPEWKVQKEQAKPIVQAYVDKYGATNRFLCDNGIYVEEYIDSYGEITRRVMTNKDSTVKSALRCSDNVNINTTEIVGGGL